MNILQTNMQNCKFCGTTKGTKVPLIEEDSSAILIPFKSVVIVAEIKTKSAKMTTLLKEMRSVQLPS